MIDATTMRGLPAWMGHEAAPPTVVPSSRTPTSSLLQYHAREGIYKLIREEPGICAQDIARRLDMDRGTATYHLSVLERHDLVVVVRKGRYARYFLRGERRVHHKEAVGQLWNPTSRRIAEVVAERPGIIQAEVCQALAMGPSLASWHLRRLAQAGVVLAERRGRTVRYTPGPAWQELQHLGAPASGGSLPAAGPAPGMPLAVAPVARAVGATSPVSAA